MNKKLGQIARTYSNDPLYSFEMALEESYQSGVKSGRDAQRESDANKNDEYYGEFAKNMILNNTGEL